MIGKETHKNAQHLTTELKDFKSNMNFSGLTRGLLKGVLFLIGSKDWSDTTKTQMVTLCDDPSQAPRIMIELSMAYYIERFPSLKPHFEAILSAVKEEE